MNVYYKILAANDGYSEQHEKKFTSLVECWQTLKDMKEFDKIEKIGCKLCVGKYIETQDSYEVHIGKVYRRGNKIFFKET